MVAQLILEFEGVGEDEYRAVNSQLGLDMETGEGDWPDGLLTHMAGKADDGRFVVTEVWRSQDDQHVFMQERLGPALQAGGITEPPARVTWIDLLAERRPGEA